MRRGAGLALGWSLPVLPLDSLLLVAEDVAAQQDQPPALWGVAMDARMGELYAARYQRLDGRWQALDEPGLWQPEALRAHWSAATLGPEALAGSGLAMLALPALPGWPAGASRAAALGRLCRQALDDGTALLDACQAMPLYVRDKVALTTAERAALVS